MTVEEAFAMMEDAEKTKEDNTVFCEIDAETRRSQYRKLIRFLV